MATGNTENDAWINYCDNRLSDYFIWRDMGFECLPVTVEIFRAEKVTLYDEKRATLTAEPNNDRIDIIAPKWGDEPKEGDNMILHILGRGEGWQDAPFDGSDKWTVNTISRHDVTMLWDMHELGSWEPHQSREHANAIVLDIPIMVLEDYPLQQMIEYFQTSFFSNSLCYMLAYAIFKGYSEINMWGCNMKVSDEGAVDYYVPEHPGVEFWCGMAKGRGIKLTIHGDSALMKVPKGTLYGYDIKQEA